MIEVTKEMVEEVVEVVEEFRRLISEGKYQIELRKDRKNMILLRNTIYNKMQ